jgi:hypothetical protein
MIAGWTPEIICAMTKISGSVFRKKRHVITVKIYGYGSESIGEKQNP